MVTPYDEQMTEMPLHAQIYNSLREQILNGDLKEGDRLPSERSLVEAFNVSRGPVRQALAALRSEGLIVGGRGSSPRIQRTVPSQPFNHFVSFSEWGRLLGAKPGQRVIEVSRRIAQEEDSARLQIPIGHTIVEIVRARYLDGEPVMIEMAMYPIEVGHPFLSADLDKESIYRIMTDHGHRPVRARNVIDAVAATDVDSLWLEIPVNSPLLRLRKTSFSKDDTVLEATNHRYHPSRATFTVDNAISKDLPMSTPMSIDHVSDAAP